jgi:phosphoenolpyruvate carboxykinase (GTP)
MLPFCGYNMGDYFAYWLAVGREHDASKLPRIFQVNWFRKGPDGRFLWPGFGENSRVLEWVFRRCENRAEAIDTPIGRIPAATSINVRGLKVPPEDLDELLRVDPAEWRDELDSIREHLSMFGAALPDELHRQLEALAARLGA